MTAWTTTETFKFIELYQNESCIWNPKHKNHRDTTKVNDAWIRISDALGIPVAEVKKKKETLMSAFRLNHKKVIQSRRSGAGEDEIFKPIWIYYDALVAFMSDVYKCKSIVNTEVHEYDSSSQEIPLPDSEEMPIPHSSSTDAQNANQVHFNDINTPIKRRSNKPPELAETSTQIKNTLSTINNVLNRKNKEIPEDDCDLYGRLLAKKLRQYSESERQEIMYEIDGMLINKKRMSARINRQYVASPSQIIISSNRPTTYSDYSQNRSASSAGSYSSTPSPHIIPCQTPSPTPQILTMVSPPNQIPSPAASQIHQETNITPGSIPIFTPDEQASVMSQNILLEAYNNAGLSHNF